MNNLNVSTNVSHRSFACSEQPWERAVKSALNQTKTMQEQSTLRDEISHTSETATKAGPTFSRSENFDLHLSQTRSINGENIRMIQSQSDRKAEMSIDKMSALSPEGPRAVPDNLMHNKMTANAPIPYLISIDSKISKSNLEASENLSETNVENSLSQSDRKVEMSIDRVSARSPEAPHAVPDDCMHDAKLIPIDSKTSKSNLEASEHLSEGSLHNNLQREQYLPDDNIFEINRDPSVWSESRASNERKAPYDIQPKKLSDEEKKILIEIKSGQSKKSLHTSNSEIYRVPTGFTGVRSSNTQKMGNIDETDKTMLSRKQNKPKEISQNCNSSDAGNCPIKTLQITDYIDEPSFIEKYHKYIFGALLLYSVLVTVLGSYSLTSLLSLNKENSALIKEVNELSSEVDHFDKEVHQLEANNSRLEIIVSDLSHEHQLSHGLLLQFNTSNIELKEVSARLVEENKGHEDSIVNLNQAIGELIELTTAIQISKKHLNATAVNLKEVNVRLELEVNHLSEEAGNLDETLQLYKVENDHLSELNENLTAIADFITGETGAIEKTYEELVSFLAGTITAKKSLARIGMKDRMQAQVAGLECAFLVAFGTKAFIQDITLPIGISSFNDVIEYANIKLFKELCIDKQNFKDFLRSEILSPGLDMNDISMQNFVRGINNYTSAVIHYYFYDFGTGKDLTDSDWDKVNYQCNNLSDGKKYKFVV